MIFVIDLFSFLIMIVFYLHCYHVSKETVNILQFIKTAEVLSEILVNRLSKL